MLKALIVDDDKNARECISKCIDWENLGFEVAGEAFNGVEALRLATEHNVDVIITDIKMPLMDGTELCRKIREVMSGVSIIILSAYEDFTTARIALKYDVNDYILKPIDLQKINHITEILVKIREEKEGEIYLSGLLKSENIGSDIMYYLKGNETQYFMDFFREVDKCAICDYTAVKMVCYKLVTILCDFLLDVGMNYEAVQKKRSAASEELSELKNQREAINYTKKMYFDILQFGGNMGDSYYMGLVGRVKECVQGNYSNPTFGIQDIAEKMNFSCDYIGRIFKKYTNITIGNYISEVRLTKAAELLRDTATPINDIAVIVGYTNPNYFAKVFKIKNNMTPSSYRNMARNELS